MFFQATLADEFLADLMEDGDVEGLEEDEVDVKQEIDTKSPFANLTPDAVKATPNPLAELKATHVRQVSKLIESNELQAILKALLRFLDSFIKFSALLSDFAFGSGLLSPSHISFFSSLFALILCDVIPFFPLFAISLGILDLSFFSNNRSPFLRMTFPIGSQFVGLSA